jgi:hypothetical protein
MHQLLEIWVFTNHHFSIFEFQNCNDALVLKSAAVQGAISAKGKQQTRHDESKRDLKVEASQESMSASEGLIIKREAQLANSYKKPIWKLPPTPIWWSPEGLSKDASEDFEMIIKQGKAARKQIAARV